MPVETTANYIRIRVASPSLFSRFRVKLLGKGIKAVIGFKKAGGSQIQSVLFPRNRFSMKEARAWISSHGYKVSEVLQEDLQNLPLTIDEKAFEVYLVYDIDIDPKTLEMKFTEEVVTDEEEAKAPRPTREPWDWLLDEDWEWTL